MGRLENVERSNIGLSLVNSREATVIIKEINARAGNHK